MLPQLLQDDDSEGTAEFGSSPEALAEGLDAVLDEVRSLLAAGHREALTRALGLWQHVEGFVTGDEAEALGRTLAEVAATEERLAAGSEAE